MYIHVTEMSNPQSIPPSYASIVLPPALSVWFCERNIGKRLVCSRHSHIRYY